VVAGVEIGLSIDTSVATSASFGELSVGGWAWVNSRDLAAYASAAGKVDKATRDLGAGSLFSESERRGSSFRMRSIVGQGVLVGQGAAVEAERSTCAAARYVLRSGSLRKGEVCLGLSRSLFSAPH